MKRYTEIQRKQFISQFQRSGMSAVAFCRAKGISTVSLQGWRRRYQRSAPPVEAAVAPWVPVIVSSEVLMPQSSNMSYVLGTAAVRLEVPRGFDVREVGALWQILAAANAGTGAAS